MARGKMNCKNCGKNTIYKLEKPAQRCSLGHLHPEIVHKDDVRRVRAELCPSCFKKELKNLLFDEVGGVLAGITFVPEPKTLVGFAKALVRHGYMNYYQASEYLVFRALKDNQDPDTGALMIPDGDKSTLSKKVVK